MSDALCDYYAGGDELARLTSGAGLLEAARTKELLLRHLPEGPLVVLDVGGGAGYYAEWLAGAGHRVTMVDLVPAHVEAARHLAGTPPRFRVQRGDARELPYPDSSFDAVLLLGPLYHLVERSDRVAALREARRVCRSGGRVFAAAISRFAPALDGIRDGWIADEASLEVVRLQVETGTAAAERPAGFGAISYFHHANELRAELEDAGLAPEAVYGVEGPSWLVPDFDSKWADPTLRERMLWVARLCEADPRLQEASAHLLGVAAPPASAG